MNKSEQVSSLGHQMSLLGSEVGGTCTVKSISYVCVGWGQVGPCTVKYHVWEARADEGSLHGGVQCIMGNDHMRASLYPVNIQTHMTENITFPQLRWQAVISIESMTN